MNMQLIHELVHSDLGERRTHPWKEPGNKYAHGQRVARLALDLRRMIAPGQDENDDILMAAAWFHDIANGQEDHAREGARRAGELLAEHVSEAELEAICALIAVHDDRVDQREGGSLILLVHQDADLLDHFGTFDVWESILYSAMQGHTLEDTARRMWEWHERHDESFLKELHFEISKQILNEKYEFLRRFLARMDVEGSGGVWGMDVILRGERPDPL